MLIQERGTLCDGASPDVRQRESESSREFEARAFVRLTKTTPDDAPRTILLCCNERDDPEVLAGRTTLCRAALALLLRAGGGEVVLMTHSGSPSRSQLAALAESLSALLVGSGLCVSTRLCTPAAQPIKPRKSSGSRRVA